MIRQQLRLLVPLAAALALAAAQGMAQPAPDAPASEQRPPSSGVLSLLPADSVTEHVIETGEDELAYSATAGTLTLRNRNGAPAAAVFYTAYTLSGADAGSRPLTFVFNGGPGASSAYLHLGLVGPRIVDFGSRPDGAQAQLQANPQTWLSFTDLVLIDPVGTGWSRAADPDKADDFWSVGSDASSLAKVIALYAAEQGRIDSAKFLLGESYGGYRAVKVARALQREQGIVVSGILMVSPFLEGVLHSGANRIALSAALLLPSIAASELDRQGRFTAEALAAAEQFAMTDYLATLAGRPPQGAAADEFYSRIAGLTGLPRDVVRRTRGFVAETYPDHADDRTAKLISPYDATFAVVDPFPGSDDGRGNDPMLDGFLQSLGGLFVGYARDQLKFETVMTYELLNREVSRKWRWNGGRHGRYQASADADLRRLLALNPSFRLLIAHGRSDLVTPYAVSRYVVDHLPEFDTAGRARLEVYRGGHMFYFDPASRTAFTAAAQAFYNAAAP
jgi:carboxypeptidase C (cathepsin A)